ncbi:L-piperidine-6-carboxylate dehydrogenase [Allopusillimonas ginsengisoli]|uniref:L-piperidine-6-carboxylate dehydrogenase n=1 Tax=Allopusillimonas ginsengisoli TaxID=453575 RepID=UPI00101F253E|nr:aldehyde dehydrogenase family protein [Allopusillimonas ginsengisoli]TEA78249.1 aldehyde dehydrogenase family protein [Allopusillimonas ginsengisoli]
MNTNDLLTTLGLNPELLSGGDLPVHSPIDGALVASLHQHTPDQARAMIGSAHEAFLAWRNVPAPRRGELVRLLGEELREHKQALGRLVSVEAGKITAEGEGEVQEMIDICDFAVGLSRQLYGLTIASERPGHRMMETWHPLGVVGVISAFNFPVAVWSWNAALALVCGDSVVWKPSEKTPLTALACQALFERALARFGDAPDGLLHVLIGGRDTGEALVNDERVALVSATGSTRMGREVGPRVAQRFGRCLLELGGNNAIIVAPSADLDMAARGILFGAVGTAGQRCTSTRRIIVHRSVAEALLDKLRQAYASARVGNPLDAGTLVGPLVDRAAYDAMQSALAQARAQGGTVTGGERQLAEQYPDAWYVSPALVEMPAQTEIVCHETFAPILYVMRYEDFDEALRMQNAVPQGLSSAIFTTDLREAERFTSAAGSDCGIANVNIGTSGAEIGGAFGGEKETGGGRESGSDSWKAYMRRATNTINYSRELPLAQGIKFGDD